MSSVHAYGQLSLSASLRAVAASPPFAATSASSGRTTHFRAVLGGEDAAQYLFYELSQSNIFAPLDSLSANVCLRSMPVAVRSGRGVQACFSPQ